MSWQRVFELWEALMSDGGDKDHSDLETAKRARNSSIININEKGGQEK